MYILYSSTFIWSTKYNQKYTVHPKVHKSTFGCAVYPVPISCRKNWSIHVNVPLGVLSTFKSESAKYIPRYKVHPKAKVQSTPCMHVSIIFWELGLSKKGKFIQSIAMCWKTLFWPRAKISSGRAGWWYIKGHSQSSKSNRKESRQTRRSSFLLGSECRVILKEMHWLVLLRVILFEMIMQCFSLCFSFFLLHSIKFDSKEVFSLSQRC